MFNWKSEFKKCLKDTTREYMIEHHIFGKPLLASQKEILFNITNNNMTVVSKSRDIGYTSIMAAYVACEMALNCDEGYTAAYIGVDRRMCEEFLRLSNSYLRRIPTQLWCSYDITINNTGDSITVEDSIIRAFPVPKKDDTCFLCSILDIKPDTLVLDECAYMKINYSDLDNYRLNESCRNIIVGSTPNPNNEDWFNFVKIYKYTSCYLELPWWTNEKHKLDENDLVNTLCTSCGEDSYKTNRWFHKRKISYDNDEKFSIEYEAKVWRYKTIKEYV